MHEVPRVPVIVTFHPPGGSRG